MAEPIKVETTITKRTFVSGKWIFVEQCAPDQQTTAGGSQEEPDGNDKQHPGPGN